MLGSQQYREDRCESREPAVFSPLRAGPACHSRNVWLVIVPGDLFVRAQQHAIDMEPLHQVGAARLPRTLGLATQPRDDRRDALGDLML
jgi:hypothetical protein